MFTQATKQYIKSHWYKHELIPLFVIIGGGVTLATVAATRALRGPDVVLNKQSVKEGETTKFLDPAGRFERKWSRDRL